MNNLVRTTITKAVAVGIVMATSTSVAFAQTTVEFKTPDKGVNEIGGLISAGINAAIIIAALLTFVFLIWGGIQWLTSGGDKAAYEAARGRITAALIGLAIVAAAWALMKVVGAFLGVDIFGGGDLDFGSANDGGGGGGGNDADGNGNDV